MTLNIRKARKITEVKSTKINYDVEIVIKLTTIISIIEIRLNKVIPIA
jgi:hypothetical protein